MPEADGTMADDLEERDLEEIAALPIEVKVINPTTERDDSADFSSYNTYEVLGAGAAGGPSPQQQILNRNDKRLQAVITCFDASGGGLGVFLCDEKQALSGQANLGSFLGSGMSIVWKGKDKLFVMPSAVKADTGDVYVGVIDQHYK